jgi:RNA polymerase sigma factor (sigma-70 family)
MVFALCSVLLRHRQEAEDATQQVFLSAQRSMLAGTVPEEPSAWLATIARNECLSRLRRPRPQTVPLRDEDHPTGADIPDLVLRRAEIAALSAAISGLPPAQRQAVILRDFYGLSYKEISLALGVSGPAVESLLFKSRKRLQQRLRHLHEAHGFAAVPAAVRHTLARAIPGFSRGLPGAAVGAGVSVKLVSGQAAAKFAALALAAGAGMMMAVAHEPAVLVLGAAKAKTTPTVAATANRPAPTNAPTVTRPLDAAATTSFQRMIVDSRAGIVQTRGALAPESAPIEEPPKGVAPAAATTPQAPPATSFPPRTSHSSTDSFASPRRTTTPTLQPVLPLVPLPGSPATSPPPAPAPSGGDRGNGDGPSVGSSGSGPGTSHDDGGDTSTAPSSSGSSEGPGSGSGSPSGEDGGTTGSSSSDSGGRTAATGVTPGEDGGDSTTTTPTPGTTTTTPGAMTARSPATTTTSGDGDHSMTSQPTTTTTTTTATTSTSTIATTQTTTTTNTHDGAAVDPTSSNQLTSGGD